MSPVTHFSTHIKTGSFLQNNTSIFYSINFLVKVNKNIQCSSLLHEKLPEITPILLMAEILHQLIGSFPIIYRVSYIPGGAGFQPSTVVPMTRDDLWTQQIWARNSGETTHPDNKFHSRSDPSEAALH